MTKKPYFDPLRIGSETLSLAHLEPFTFTVDSEKAKKTLKIRVTFSNHCFTKRFYPRADPAGLPLLVTHTPRPRIFCPIRYRLSFRLPQLIQEIQTPGTRVLQTTSRRNWAYSIRIEDPEGPYHVFFELVRSGEHQKTFQDLNLVVESAYHEDPEGEKPTFIGKIGFVVLCGKVYLREPVATKR